MPDVSDRSLLVEIEERVHGYFTGAPVPEWENPKERIVRETCEVAIAHGVTADELRAWALQQQGELSVAVCSANALRALQTRLKRPGGVERFRKRLARGKAPPDSLSGPLHDETNKQEGSAI